MHFLAQCPLTSSPEKIGLNALVSKGLTNLQSLDISHNKLTHLGPNLFVQLHRLTDLDLSANSIGSIHRLAFQVKVHFKLFSNFLCLCVLKIKSPIPTRKRIQKWLLGNLIYPIHPEISKLTSPVNYLFSFDLKYRSHFLGKYLMEYDVFKNGKWS